MAPLLAQQPRMDRAFERLYRRHVADVYHYALAVLRNSADAEDVAQTTFLNAYRAYQRGERPDSPHNWLIAIAHNVCRQRFRQSARRPSEVAFDEDVSEAFVDPDAPSAEDIRKALGYLAFNQRAALVMRELEGRSYAEIAEILGLTVSAVETLIFRARRALREQLEGSLTCHQAELAISRQIDGRLPRAERGALRAHLRECGECATFARSQRAQRAAFKGLAAVPLPSSLASFFGGAGGSAVGGAAAGGVGLAVKAAITVAVATLVGGVGYEGAKRIAPSSGSGSPATPARHPDDRAAPDRATVRLGGQPAAASRGQARSAPARSASERGRADEAASRTGTPPGRRAGGSAANGNGRRAAGQGSARHQGRTKTSRAGRAHGPKAGRPTPPGKLAIRAPKKSKPEPTNGGRGNAPPAASGNPASPPIAPSAPPKPKVVPPLPPAPVGLPSAPPPPTLPVPPKPKTTRPQDLALEHV